MNEYGLFLQYDENNTIVMISPTDYEYYPLGYLPCLIFQGETYYALTRIIQNYIRIYPGANEKLNTKSIEDAIAYLRQCFLYDEFRHASSVGMASFLRIMKKINTETAVEHLRQLLPTLEDECDYILPVYSISTIGDYLTLCYNYYIIDLTSGHDEFFALAYKQMGKSSFIERNTYQLFLERMMDIPPIEMKLEYKKNKNKFVPIYRVNSFEAYMALEYMQMANRNIKFRCCQNPECNRLFVAKRLTAKYCDFPSPQKVNKSCKEVYPQIACQIKMTQDTLLKKICGTKSRLYVTRKRHPEWSELINPFFDDIDIKQKENCEKVLSGEWTQLEFSQWLDSMRIKK